MAQLRALTEQLAGLTAQRQVLRRQLNSSRTEIAAQAATELPKVESQAARVSVDLADVRARLGAGQTTMPPNFNNNNNRRSGMDSDNVTAIMIVFILAVLMPLSIGITRRLLRRSPKDTGVATNDMLSPRLDRLENAVDAIAIEIERIAEGQRFVTKVMAERPTQAPARAQSTPRPAEAVDPSAQALGEAKPFLALGAGPIEPVRAPERQSVRQSITPH